MLTYFKAQVTAANLGVTPLAMKPPRSVALQDGQTVLYIFPRRTHQARRTMSDGHGFREISYQPMDFVLRQAQNPEAIQDWIPFLGLADAVQAFILGLGETVPITIIDPVTLAKTSLSMVEESGDITYDYAPVIAPGGVVVTQADFAANVQEYQRGASGVPPTDPNYGSF